MLTVFLRPYSLILVVGLALALVGEGLVMKLKIVKPKVAESKGLESMYDKRFVKALETLRRSYTSIAFKYKSSTTVREMVEKLLIKFPEHKDLFNSILLSMESHVYGGNDLKDEDFANYSRLTQLPRGVPKR